MKKLFALLLTLILGISIVSCGEGSSFPPLLQPVDYASQFKLDMTSSTLKEEVTVKQCIDGDTTHFYTDAIGTNGFIKTRYLCIDTPESTGQVQKWGKTASLYNKERLNKAVSIIVESNDGNWNLDSTSERYLVYVWYKLNANDDYKCLNLEILQEGYAAAKTIGESKYAEVFQSAYSQAIALKLHYFGNEVDVNWDAGSFAPVDLKEIRTHLVIDPNAPEEEQYTYVDKKVRFEGVITQNAGGNVYHIEDVDLDSGVSYAIPVFVGYSFKGMEILKVGNRLSIAATITYSEGFGYQASGLNYYIMTPNREDATRLISEGNEVVPNIVSGEDINTNGEMLDSTYVKVENLTVVSIYTTTDPTSSSVGAMTLTCKDSNNDTVKVRTSVLHDENKNLITKTAFEGKNITVVGTVDQFEGDYQVHLYTISDVTFNN